jgi:hypothetical protein
MIFDKSVVDLSGTIRDTISSSVKLHEFANGKFSVGEDSGVKMSNRKTSQEMGTGITSLDRSGGSVFRIKRGAARVP